jgi:hypothetical protein
MRHNGLIVLKGSGIMINAPHDKEFIFHDGTRARNLLDLVAKLEGISDHEFHNFVNHHKNDFANWTEHVLLDKHFADELRNINSRSETIQIIKDKINEVTIGSSVIRIPRIEDHHNQNHIIEKSADKAFEEHKHRTGESIANAEKHDEGEKHAVHEPDERHAAAGTHNIESHKNEIHKNEMHDNETHILSESPQEKKEKHHEKSEQMKAGHNWFKLFSSKNLSEKKIEKIEIEEEDKLKVEKSLKDEVAQNDRENALWIILYFALVLLIITLLVYKLFL